MRNLAVAVLAGAMYFSVPAVLMASDQSDRLLALHDRSVGGQSFDFQGFQHLDFESTELDNFLWNKTGEKIVDFNATEAFTDFEEVYVGYDPINRDHGEIRIYAAKLVPEKVGLAADYGRLFAREWGPLNFGTRAHSPTFGEVMTGRKNSDEQEFTRISIFRRGSELLIIRTDGPEETWGEFENRPAAFVGSLRFVEAMGEDPVQATFEAHDLQVPFEAGRPGEIVVDLPPNWRALPISSDDPSKGVYQFYIDGADEARNNAAMLFSIDVDASGKPDVDKIPAAARTLVEVFLDNILPDQPYNIERVSAGHFSEYDRLVQANGYYSFKVDFPEIGILGVARVLVTLKDGQVVGYATIFAYPADMIRAAAALQPTLVEEQFTEGMKLYWSHAADVGEQ